MIEKLNLYNDLRKVQTLLTPNPIFTHVLNTESK